MEEQTVVLEVKLRQGITPDELVRHLAFLFQQSPDAAQAFQQIWIESNTHLQVVDFPKTCTSG